MIAHNRSASCAGRGHDRIIDVLTGGFSRRPRPQHSLEVLGHDLVEVPDQSLSESYHF